MVLRTQHLVPALAPTKIRLSMLSVATVDALGGPAEFRPRFSFPFITTMIPNAHFGLSAGVWTDDTSMTLCLARSLSTYTAPGSTRAGGFDEAHQLDMYSRWCQRGYLSATGSCFDIGGTIQRALSIWSNRNSAEPSAGVNQQALQRIKTNLDGDYCCGNGSLMRILPIGLAYWRNEEAARKYAWRSSDVTHPNKLCGEASEVWTSLIVRIMKEAAVSETKKKFTKLDLLRDIAAFPYTQAKLKDMLVVPSSAPPPPNPGTDKELEEYYRTFHPLLVLISQASTESGSPYLTTPVPPTKRVPSTGYVLHTFIAALYAFFSTLTFEEGAIMVVNMGYDADTVGAVYGGLAGCWYGGERGLEGGLFWTPTVDDWMGDLVKLRRNWYFFRRGGGLENRRWIHKLSCLRFVITVPTLGYYEPMAHLNVGDQKKWPKDCNTSQ